MANTHSADLESGSSQYFSRADDADYDFSGDFSIEGWIKLETNISQYVLMKGSTASSQKWYGFWLEPDGKLNFTIDNGTTAYTADTDAGDGNLATGVWYHFAGVRSGSDISLYVNGELQETVSATSDDLSNSDSLLIGARNTGSINRYFDGLINDVRIWSDARTPSEIQDNIGSDTLDSTTNLEGRYKFNNNAEDSSSNGNDLTANNSPTYTTDVPYSGTTFVASMQII